MVKYPVGVGLNAVFRGIGNRGNHPHSRVTSTRGIEVGGLCSQSAHRRRALTSISDELGYWTALIRLSVAVDRSSVTLFSPIQARKQAEQKIAQIFESQERRSN